MPFDEVENSALERAALREIDRKHAGEMVVPAELDDRRQESSRSVRAVINFAAPRAGAAAGRIR